MTPTGPGMSVQDVLAPAPPVRTEPAARERRCQDRSTLGQLSTICIRPLAICTQTAS